MGLWNVGQRERFVGLAKRGRPNASASA